MKNFNTGEVQSALAHLALGEELVLNIRGGSTLRWRVVNTRQGWHSFVDVRDSVASHFEFITSTPDGPRLLAGAMVEAQIAPVLTHRDTALACVGVAGESEELPADWRRHIKGLDVPLSWIDQSASEVGAHLVINEDTSADVRLRGDVATVWIRSEKSDSTQAYITEHFSEQPSKGLIALLKRGKVVGEPSTGSYKDVQRWAFGGGGTLANVEVRRGWVDHER